MSNLKIVSLISNWLESKGQNPRTFVKDVILLVIAFYVATYILILPAFVIAHFDKSIFPTARIPGAKPTMPPKTFVFMFLFPLWGIFVIVFAGSLVGGWYKLAHHFRAPHKFQEGQLFKNQSASVGVWGYGRVLNIRVAPQGLYLSCKFPYGLLHPPLLIPWDKIRILKQKGLSGRVTNRLLIGSPKLASIVLENPKILEAAQPWLPQETQIIR